jgi:hypothetical protein
VLLPVPDEGPALTNYQEAGQLPGVGLSLWVEMIFGENRVAVIQKQADAFA